MCGNLREQTTNMRKMKNSKCVILSVFSVVLSSFFALSFIWIYKKGTENHLAVSKNEHTHQIRAHNLRVFFQDEKESIQPGLVIHIMDVTTNSIYVKEFATNEVFSLNFIIRNESKNDIFILLDPPPFSLEWVEITTDRDVYQFDYPIVVRGPPSWPVNSIFFSGNRVWKSTESFSVAKTFNQAIPSPLLNDLPAELEPEFFSTKPFGDERIVAGQLRVSCDISYFVVSENGLRTQRLSKNIKMDMQKIGFKNVLFRN